MGKVVLDEGPEVLVAHAGDEQAKVAQGGKEAHYTGVSKAKSRRPVAGISRRQDHGLERCCRWGALLGLAFEIQETVVDIVANLPEGIEIGKEFAHSKVVGIVDGGFSTQGAVAFPVLLDGGPPVFYVDRWVDARGEDPCLEGAFSLPAWDALVEEHLHLFGSPQVELVADHLLKELPSMERAVEDIGATHLHLEDGQLVGIARCAVVLGERAGEAVDPLVEVALNVGRAEPVRRLLESDRIIYGGKAIVERLVGNVPMLHLALEPLIAVEPDPDAPGCIRTDLDEAGPKVVIPDVEIDVLHKDRGAGDGVLALLPLQLVDGAEGVRLLLGDTDHDHALALRSSKVRCSDGLLALPALKMHHRDVLLLSHAVNLGHEGFGHLSDEGVAGDLLTAMFPQEVAEALCILEPGDVAIEKDTVDTLTPESYVFIQQTGNITHGAPLIHSHPCSYSAPSPRQ